MLDDTHIYVQADVGTMLSKKLEEFIDQNTFVKPLSLDGNALGHVYLSICSSAVSPKPLQELELNLPAKRLTRV
ncbi:hypothetical protein KC19_VG059800 [Ceratodon purpureus]|uniref:General transcription and DNA repair factor IIH subunit TFB5 n=1 Tax=Ceratodon purpureus TaxID=3225 RepID=A0A8T0HMH0_CERPU|nr:hypothetical protein KC19_VG059800 [Ceratodon purpureus]